MGLWRPTLGVLLVLLAADASLASSNAASVAPKDSTTAKNDAKAHTAADTINYYTIIIRGEPAPAGSSAQAPNSGPTGSGKPKELVVDSIEDVERLVKKWRQQKQQQQQPKKAARTPGSGSDSKEGTPAPDEILKDFLESHSVFGPDSSNKQLEEEPADSNTGDPTEETQMPDQQTSDADDDGSSSSRSSRGKEDSSSSQDSSKDADNEDSRHREEPDESSSSSEEESEDSSSRTRVRESDRSNGDEEQPQRSSRRKKQEGEQEGRTSRGTEQREARGEEEGPEHGDSEADAPRRRQQQQADDSERKQRSSRSKARGSEGSSRAKDTDSADGRSRVRRQQPDEDPSEGHDSRRADSKQRSEERVDDSKQRSEERDSRRADSKQRSEEREAEAPRDRDTGRERSYADTREEEERQQTRDADEYRRGYEDGSDDRRSSKEGREEPEPSDSYPRLEEDGVYFRRPELHSTCLQVIKATGDASGLSTYDLRCCDHKDDPKVCMKTEGPTYTSFNSHAAAPSPKSMMEILKSHGSQKVATCAFTPTDAPCPASESGHPAGGCQAFKGTCMLAKSASECGCPSGTGTGVLLEVTAFAYRAAALSCSPVFTTAQPDAYYGGYAGPDALDDGPPYLGVGVVMKGSGHVLADNDLRARMTFISGFGVPTQPAPIYGRRRQLLSGGRDATIVNEAILRARMGTKAPSPPVTGMSGLGFGWRAPAVSHSRQSAAVTPMYGPYSLQGPYSSRQPPMAFTPAPSTPLPVPDLPFLLGGRMIIEWIAAPSK